MLKTIIEYSFYNLRYACYQPHPISKALTSDGPFIYHIVGLSNNPFMVIYI